MSHSSRDLEPGYTARSHQHDGDATLSIESAIDALQASPEFQGTVERLDGTTCNDHLAMIYESRDEQFAAVVPYLRQGLERGERCMYVVDETTQAQVIEALHAGGIDVAGALESGQLSFHTTEDTYLRNGRFDPDEMLEFYENAIEAALEDYSALRIAAETGWILHETTETEQFMAYESRVNDLFEDEDCIALCQYDRRRMPPEIIRDIIRTHPHLVCDGTVCHNFYYTPPEEYLGPDEPARDVNRMMRTLVERTEVKATLQDREQFLREQNDIIADPDASFETKLQQLFELGCRRFDMELGGLARVDRSADSLVIESTSDDHEHLTPGTELPLSECYCRSVADGDTAVGIADPVEAGFGDSKVLNEFGLHAYLGMHVEVAGEADRTFFFVSPERRETPFSEAELTFHRVMGQWISYELERQQRERFLQKGNEVTSSPDLTFEEKLDRLLAMGCARFGVDIGFLAHTTCTDFEVIAARGSHPDIQPGSTDRLERTYCRKALASDDPVCVTDASTEGWADDPAFEAYELASYAGVEIRVQNDTYGTLCFADERPRDRPFSDAEVTFLELLGQWVSYELEREHREAQLAALNEMSRALMSAESQGEIAERSIRHAAETLQLPVTAIVGYNEDTGTLESTAETPRATDELPSTALCEPGSGPFWEAFVTNEPRVIDDIAAFDGAGDDLSAAVAIPLGRHGMFVTATYADAGFSEAAMDFIEATATTVKAAFARADREQLLHEREQALEEQNRTLQRLNQVNDIIRNIHQALVEASSRTEIEAVVCEQLADVGPYELAWIGEHDPVAEVVTPRESAGAEKGYLEGITVTTDDRPEGQGPTGRAFRTRTPQVVNNVLDDQSFGPWRQAALTRGYHASIALPLEYEDTLYGVLNVYATQPGVFGELERTVLIELADTIAYAINAVESKKALVSSQVSELEFDLSDTDLAETAMTAAVDCSFTLEKLVPQTNGGFRCFFTTRGAAAREIESAADLPVAELSVISTFEDDGVPVAVFEGELLDGSIIETILAHGGRPLEFTVSAETARMVVTLAAEADIRSFVETLQTRYPGTELVAQRTREQAGRTLAELHATLYERLTPRQREALQVAFYSGYFDKPRVRTGSEIAETMGISQPTFNAHLRAAHRKLCELLFDVEPENAGRAVAKNGRSSGAGAGS